MRVIDMHSHLPELEKTSFDVQKREVEYRLQQDMITCYSCGSPQEWIELRPFLDGKQVFATFGIHPWFADRFQVSDYMDLFRACSAVGEIGLDGFLSEAPLEIQKKQLELQLQIAADLKKPIVIHADGREKETAEIIKDFPGKILIHWFSGERDMLESLLEKDCFFSLGPDTDLIYAGKAVLGDEKKHEARKYLVEHVPLDRVFAETDGLEAILWARGLETGNNDWIPQVLKNSLDCLSGQRGVDIRTLTEQMERNFHAFLG